MSGTDFYYEPQVRLAEELAAIVPIAGRRAIVLRQLRHRGDRSVPQAGALRDRPPEHHRVPRRRSTAARMGSLALTASKAVQRRGFGPLMPGVYHAPYRGLLPLSASALTPESCAAECLDFIEHQLFVHLVSPDEVAAIVVEPIQGEGGYIVPPDAVPAAAARADEEARHPARGRRSAVGHGADREDVRDRALGVEPDVVAIAKGIASGMPLGVAVARADLMTWPPGAHASTFGGNPVSCAAALATIKLLKEQLMANAADVGAHLMAGLKALAGQASAHRRRARARADDRRRAGARSADEGARHHRARRGRHRRVHARAAGARRREERDPLLAAAGADARAGGHRGQDLRRGADARSRGARRVAAEHAIGILCVSSCLRRVCARLAWALLGWRHVASPCDLGKTGEDLACAELERRGYAIVARRYRRRGGELDIIARDGGDDGVRRGEGAATAARSATRPKR